MASHKATRLIPYKRRDMWSRAGSTADAYMAKLTHSSKTDALRMHVSAAMMG